MEDLGLMRVDMRKDEVGLLKTKGVRKIVQIIYLIDGADKCDDEKLIEEVKLAYEKYHARVSEYVKVE